MTMCVRSQDTDLVRLESVDLVCRELGTIQSQYVVFRFFIIIDSREALDKLELGCDLASLVGNLLLGPVNSQDLLHVVQSRAILLQLRSIGAVLEGNLKHVSGDS